MGAQLSRANTLDKEERLELDLEEKGVRKSDSGYDKIISIFERDEAEQGKSSSMECYIEEEAGEFINVIRFSLGDQKAFHTEIYDEKTQIKEIHATLSKKLSYYFQVDKDWRYRIAAAKRSHIIVPDDFDEKTLGEINIHRLHQLIPIEGGVIEFRVILCADDERFMSIEFAKQEADSDLSSLSLSEEDEQDRKSEEEDKNGQEKEKQPPKAHPLYQEFEIQVDAKPYALRIHFPYHLHRFDLLDKASTVEIVITRENLLNCYADEHLMAVNLQTLEKTHFDLKFEDRKIYNKFLEVLPQESILPIDRSTVSEIAPTEQETPAR